MDPDDPAFAIFLEGLGGTPTQRMLVHLRTAFECGVIVGQRREVRATMPLIRSAMTVAESLTAELRAQTDRVESLTWFAAGKAGDRN